MRGMRTPVNRKYGTAMMRRAPSAAQRASPSGSDGLVTPMKHDSTHGYRLDSHSSRDSLNSSLFASGSLEPRPTTRIPLFSADHPASPPPPPNPPPLSPL